MNIVIRNSGDIPIYEQIVTQMKEKIMSGELSEGEMLPSIRMLAKDLRISVITTKRAYEELERDGFIVSVTGRGSFVSGTDRELIREENLKKIEKGMQDIVDTARMNGVSFEELLEMLRLIYEEDR